MSRKTLVGVSLGILLVLAAAAGRGMKAQTPPEGGAPVAVAFYLPESAVGEMPDTILPPVVVSLQRDTDLPYRGVTSWKANDQIGLVLQGSSLQYPLAIHSVQCFLATYAGSVNSVNLQAHVYAYAGGTIGALLGSSEVLAATLNKPICDFSITFSDPVEIAAPQPFVVALQFVSGADGSTPAMVFDITHDIPEGVAFYRIAPDGWEEHYDMGWRDGSGNPIPPSEFGYPMLRAWAETSGGPSDITVQEASAADTTIGSSQAMGIAGAGSRPYVELGDCGDRGTTRALLRFALPAAPIAGATPIAASLRLYHNGRLTVTVPMTVTTYRANQDWGEISPPTGWYTHSTAYAEAYGSDDIPSRSVPSGSQQYLLQFDVSQLALKWYQGAYQNQGVLLIGNEGVANGCKEFQSREWQTAAQRPKLIVQWALPAATPFGTPGATATRTPTRTAQPTATSTPSITPTGLPTSTRTPTITPGGPTLTPATKGVFLPMIRKA